MFYRFYGIFKPLAEKWAGNKIYGFGLLSIILLVLIIFRLIWIFLYRFIDLKPDIGIKEIIAGLIGAFYALLWMGAILKALQYFGSKPVLNIIEGTFSAHYIMPLPHMVYKTMVTVGGKIFTGGRAYET